MKSSMLTPEMLAAFQARGGNVERVDSDAKTMNKNDWYLAERGIAPPREERSDFYRSDEQLAEMEMEAVQQAALVGGQSAAINTLNDWRSRRHGRINRSAGKRDYAAQARYNDEWGVSY